MVLLTSKFVIVFIFIDERREAVCVHVGVGVSSSATKLPRGKVLKETFRTITPVFL